MQQAGKEPEGGEIGGNEGGLVGVLGQGRSLKEGRTNEGQYQKGIEDVKESTVYSYALISSNITPNLPDTVQYLPDTVHTGLSCLPALPPPPLTFVCAEPGRLLCLPAHPLRVYDRAAIAVQAYRRWMGGEGGVYLRTACVHCGGHIYLVMQWVGQAGGWLLTEEG